MGKFEKLNKNITTARTNGENSVLKSNESVKKETEAIKEVESIQIEQKSFLRRIKKFVGYFFHIAPIAPKESFKKAMRIVALATVLSAPIGEKAFAEREVNAKESTVVTVQIDKEIDKLEQAQGSELFERIIEQRQLLKEKYNTEIVGDNSEYTPKELKDFDEALEKVQKFAPKQFGELKIVLKKIENNILGMFAETNFCNELDNPILKSKNNMFLFNKLAMQRELVKMQEIIQRIENDDGNVNSYYDVIFSVDKKAVIKLKLETLKKNKIDIIEIESVPDIGDIEKNVYKNILIHELLHLIALNNPNLYKELTDKFNEINKKVDGSSMIIHPILYMDNLNIKRYPGFVSAYAGANIINLMKSGYSNKYDKENHSIDEDITETMTYMINDHHYADDDPIVQEKIKTNKEFINKKENE